MAVLVFLLHCSALSNYAAQSDTVAAVDTFISLIQSALLVYLKSDILCDLHAGRGSADEREIRLAVFDYWDAASEYS